MSVRQAQREIDSGEFAEWMAYYQIEPFGEMVADIRHGLACALLANVNRDRRTQPTPYVPEDFIPWAERDDAPVLYDDPNEQAEAMIAGLFGHAPVDRCDPLT